MTYCTDTDLLFWEPDLAREARMAADVVHAGGARREGTRLCFVDPPIRAIEVGQLVCVEGATFPIVTVAGSCLAFSPMLRREAQRAIVSRSIDAALRVRPGDRIVVTDRLRRIAALAALRVVSAQLSIFGSGGARWGVRRDVYARLLRREMRAGSIGIDTTGDGTADVHRGWILPAELATEVL
ncbi:MAG TPA: hypothetical protein PKB10_02975 [Tepidisphaeraceae bacterium]|nr:hypothetical protein [Tepidisphaeraceae bacterium]